MVATHLFFTFYLYYFASFLLLYSLGTRSLIYLIYIYIWIYTKFFPRAITDALISASFYRWRPLYIFRAFPCAKEPRTNAAVVPKIYIYKIHIPILQTCAGFFFCFSHFSIFWNRLKQQERRCMKQKQLRTRCVCSLTEKKKRRERVINAWNDDQPFKSCLVYAKFCCCCSRLVFFYLVSSNLSDARSAFLYFFPPRHAPDTPDIFLLFSYFCYKKKKNIREVLKVVYSSRALFCDKRLLLYRVNPKPVYSR